MKEADHTSSLEFLQDKGCRERVMLERIYTLSHLLTSFAVEYSLFTHLICSLLSPQWRGFASGTSHQCALTRSIDAVYVESSKHGSALRHTACKAVRWFVLPGHFEQPIDSARIFCAP